MMGLEQELYQATLLQRVLAHSLVQVLVRNQVQAQEQCQANHLELEHIQAQEHIPELEQLVIATPPQPSW